MKALSEKESREKQRDKGHSFFDVPFGSSACSCGENATIHGHCQKCWDEIWENDETKTIGKIVG